ncbi:unnamed protein product, partial [Trichobilharzia regenti]
YTTLCLEHKSKRVTCHKKYKIIKKNTIGNYARKVVSAVVIPVYKQIEKDPGIPNILPFKESILKHVEETKNKAKLRNFEYLKKQNLREKDVVNMSDTVIQLDVKDVINQSDVVLEVLDARDPMGTRCLEIEKMVANENKRLVLLVNKIGMSCLFLYVQILVTIYPLEGLMLTSMGRCRPSKGYGTSDLLSLLANYSRDPKSRLSLTVGVVGLPNTGKSALINTLKRQKVCVSGNVPGLTRHSQRVRIDKNLYLLDTPGTLVSKTSDTSDLVLKNCVKVNTFLSYVFKFK